MISNGEPSFPVKKADPQLQHTAAEEEEVQTLVDDFLERLQAGAPPSIGQYLLAHPQLAEELEGRLEAVQFLHQLAKKEKSLAPGQLLSSARIDQETRALDFHETPLSKASWVSDFDPLQTIGRYKDLRRIACGASAVVYRAFDPKFDREVALKVFRLDLAAGSDIRKRFARDARIAAQLRHPNIVPLHETGEEAGFQYIDMELIRGETLETRLQRHPGKALDFRVAAELVQKIALALHYAHENGIVHRDIKPSNILLADSNTPDLGMEEQQGWEPQITDFDLSRRTAGEESITVRGQILGTPAYMSPEQAQGRAHEADARSDVYSLGVVFYRLLVGRLPFQSSQSFTLLTQIVEGGPLKPRTVHPAVPRDLETICLKAIEKDPNHRFPSARAFAEELGRWLRGDPLTIRPPALLERSRRWAHKHRAVARVTVAAGLVVFVVATTLGWAAWWQGKQANEARVRAVQVEGQAELARTREILEAQTRAEVQCWALMDQARQRLRLPTQGRRWVAQDILREIAEPRGHLPSSKATERLDLALRSLYAATLGGLELKVLDKADLPPIPFYVWPVALHPEGEWLAIGTPKRPVRWTRGQELQKPEVLDTPAERPRLAFSPDGKMLAFAPGQGGLELWDGGVSQVLARLEPPQAAEVLAVGFDREVKAVWAVHADGKVCSWNLPHYRPGRRWEIVAKTGSGRDRSNPSRFTAAAFNTDATLLAMGDVTDHVFLYQSTGQFLRELQSGRVEVTALAWSPDGRLAAVGSHDGSIDIWRADDGIPVHHFPATGTEVSSLFFHPSGRWVLAGRRGVNTAIWEVDSGEQVLTGPEVPWGIAANGRRLAFAGLAEVGFADLLIPQAVRQLTGHRAHLEKIAWSRDNRHLVSMDSSFEVRIWNRDCLVAVEAFRPPPGSFYADNAAVAISDDGRLVAYTGGGECQALIWDVQTHRALFHWQMGRGFDKLSYAGQNKFLLVRQEEVRENSREWQTVVRELEVGKPAPVVRVIRPLADGDRGVRGSGLTPDGKFYWWWGPRDPVDRRRLEVRDVTTGRLVAKVETPHNKPFHASLSSDGRYLWVLEGKEYRQFDLHRDQPAQRVPTSPCAYSPESKWMTYFLYSGSNEGIPALSLRRWGEEHSSLELINMDLSGPSLPCFSPDGRLLAWGNQSGTITVADVEALLKEVRQFEEQVLPK